MRFPCCLGVLVLLLPGGVVAQTQRLELTGLYPREQFGFGVERIGDLDGDGVAELLVTRGEATPLSARPELYVHSGADGHRLFTLPGAGPLDVLFRLSLLALPDLDHDGAPEIAFGTTSARAGGAPNRGRVTVFSGRTGTRLFLSEGSVSSGAFGASLAVLGDVDLDGTPELVVGQIGTQDENAWVVSGADGRQLGHVHGPGAGDPEFGWSVAGVGDLDRDGCDDFAVGMLRGGELSIYSSRRLVRLAQYAGGRSFGRALADLGDLDGDGFHELLVGESGRRVAWILSVRTGQRIPVPTLDRAESLAAVGDLDGDGRSEFLIGDGAAEEGRGSVRLFSSRNLSALAKWSGRRAGDHLGASVAGGRVGRGTLELVFGAPGADGGPRGGDAGAAQLWTIAR